MTQEPPLETFYRGVKAALREGGVSLKAGSVLLEHFPEYLGRALTPEGRLKVPELFVLLERVGVHPSEFFEIYFPLGGQLSGGPEFLDEDDDPPRPPQPSRQPEVWAERAAELLRKRIRAQGKTQREVSLAIGLARDALGKTLRGDSQFTWWLVFETLRVLEVTPGRFFFELCCEPRRPADALRWSELLDLWERRLSELASLPKPPQPPKPGRRSRKKLAQA
jgi:transcriptional regulator with XRE-family HTH domain